MGMRLEGMGVKLRQHVSALLAADLRQLIEANGGPDGSVRHCHRIAAELGYSFAQVYGMMLKMGRDCGDRSLQRCSTCGQIGHKKLWCPEATAADIKKREEISQRSSKVLSKVMTEIWADPKRRKKQVQSAEAAALRSWSDPEKKAARIEKIRATRLKNGHAKQP